MPSSGSAVFADTPGSLFSTLDNWNVRVPESLRARAVSSGLADVYDRFSREPLRPWVYADAALARRHIDDAVEDVFGISVYVIAF